MNNVDQIISAMSVLFATVLRETLTEMLSEGGPLQGNSRVADEIMKRVGMKYNLAIAAVEEKVNERVKPGLIIDHDQTDNA